MAQALHEAAEAENAALLVVGSTRRGAVGRVLPGSTAERLLHGAPCPVAVVPRRWTRDGAPETIGVAFVDTPEGREALRSAHALARRAGAKLRVLTVVRVTLTMYAETEAKTAARRAKYLEDVLGEHQRAAVEAARRAVASLDGDVDVEVDGFVGDPAETSSASRSISTCSSAARADTGRCAPCCSEACHGESWPRRAAP